MKIENGNGKWDGKSLVAVQYDLGLALTPDF